MKNGNDIKIFYQQYADEIIKKRFHSPYALRRYVHAQQYENILRFVQPGMKVLDAGCGEGVLSFMMAVKGAYVTGCDISEPNIASCIARAKETGVETITFITADSERLPFDDDTFDLVISSHVLEHLPDFDKGLAELMRVTKKRAIIAIPTILNPCALVQVGGGMFWLKGPRSFAGLFSGFFKMVLAFVLFREGVDETYAGKGVPHIFRFPRIMKQKAKKAGYHIASYEAASICLPYFEWLLPIIRILDTWKGKIFFRNFGYGTTYVVEK